MHMMLIQATFTSVYSFLEILYNGSMSHADISQSNSLSTRVALHTHAVKHTHVVKHTHTRTCTGTCAHYRHTDTYVHSVYIAIYMYI